MPLLEVNDLKIHYQSQSSFFRKTALVKAVDGVSFQIHCGEAVGLVGESGSGKTTLGRCILRLIEPTDGEILFDGNHLEHLTQTELRPFRRQLQAIFQDPFASLNPRMSVARIMEEPMIIHRTAKKRERLEIVQTLMQKVGLDPSAWNRYPHEFSAGQKQRIAIARATALSPRLIIADEPVSALDVSVQSHILSLMNQLKVTDSVAFLFISHDFTVVDRLCDRVAVMYLGKFVEISTVAQLFQKASHPYTQLLLQSIPVHHPALRKIRTERRETLETTPPPSGCKFFPRCPIAMNRCHQEEPKLRETSPGHQVACHLA